MEEYTKPDKEAKRLLTMLSKIQFLNHPKIYLLSKLFLVLIVILQRIIMLCQNREDHKEFIPFYAIQMVIMLLFVAVELGMYYYIQKYQTKKLIGEMLILILQIAVSQALVELTLQTIVIEERRNMEVVFQEILFLNCHVVLFVGSRPFKSILLFYVSLVSLFRLSNFKDSVQYISWSLMAFVFLSSTLMTFKSKEKVRIPSEPQASHRNSFKLETAMEGVAIVTREKQVLAMNGLFRSILECPLDHEALDRLLKLRRFDAYSSEAQSSFLRGIKLSKAPSEGKSPSKESKSFGDLPKSTTYIKSLEVPTPRVANNDNGGSVRHRPSIFQRNSILHRTSIMQRGSIYHRTSISQQPSIFFNGGGPSVRKTSNFLSASSHKIETLTQIPSSRHPMIKINLSKADEEPTGTDLLFNGKPIWNETDAKSPLIHLAPEPSFGVDSVILPNLIKSSRSSPHDFGHNQLDISLNPDQSHYNIATNDHLTFPAPKSETLEQIVEGLLDGMARSPEKRHNLVVTQLIDNLNSPLDYIKGDHNIPTQNRNESTTVGAHLGIDKWQVVFREGKIKILEVTMSPFIYQNKDCICITVKDVSYEVKCEDISENLEYKNKMLKYVSHEFRTPLNSIMPIIETLKNKANTPEEVQNLRTVLNSAKMLQTLVSDLLDQVQMQARKFKIVIVPCKMKKLLEEVIDIMETQAIARKCKLRLQWDGRIPQRFYTDPNRLRQIVINLVSNALKFTSKGNVTIQATYVNSTICKIAVTDTGVGISKQSQKDLFREFGKLQENSRLNLNGIGLGLVISKLLSQELSPDNEGLNVDSEEGKGTTFYFHLESKIDNFDDLIDDDNDLHESLDENSESPTAIIKTIYEKIYTDSHSEQALFSPKFKSFKSNISRATSISRSPTRKISMSKSMSPKRNLRSKNQKYSVASQSFIRKETASPTNLSHSMNFMIPHSRTVEHINLILPPKKKSSDNIILRAKKPTSPTLKNLYGREIRAGAHRAYTFEDLSETILSRNMNELEKVIKTIQHQCPNPKVLVVDDNAFNLQTLSYLLKGFNVDCQTVTDGSVAIQDVIANEGCCVKCKNYKIIFMDVEMPNMNGFEVTSVLRRKMVEGEISFIPIIGVTGHNPNENRVQCLVSGMMDLVAKPVTHAIIKELLLKWMGT